MPNAVVADPLPAVAAGLGSLLEKHHYTLLACATSMISALRIVREARADLLVLDGSIAVPALAAGAPDTSPLPRVPTLVLGGALAGEEVQALMRAGAGGVVDKGLPVADLLQAAEDVRRGERVLCAAMRERLTEAAIAPERPAALSRPLTAREIDVLELMTAGASTETIASTLHMSPTTVKTHLRNLYAKLDSANRAEAAARAVRLGLIA